MSVSLIGGSLERLRALLLEEGGLMASLVDDAPLDEALPEGSTVAGSTLDEALPEGSTPDGLPRRGFIAGSPMAGGPPQLAASGPRVNGRGPDYELLLEAIYEGYLLHYRSPRVVKPPEQDLGLLAGDRLYALGLARLIKLGDIEAVAELADVITLSALGHGAGTPELADAVWMAGARAVGWGSTSEHEHAKALVRAGSPEALEAMRSLTGP